MELLGSSPIPRSFAASCVRLQLRPLPFTGITRLRWYYRPIRHPTRPGLSLASCQLIPTATTAGASRLVSYAYMPSPLPRQVRWSWFARLSPSSAAFPVKQSGRLLQLLFRDLLSVYSRYGLHARGVASRPFPSKAPTASLPPPPLPLLPGGANQFPDGSCTR